MTMKERKIKGVTIKARYREREKTKRDGKREREREEGGNAVLKPTQSTVTSELNYEYDFCHHVVTRAGECHSALPEDAPREHMRKNVAVCLP